MKKILWFVVIGFLCAAAYFIQSREKEIIVEIAECFCPHVTIYLQPYNNYSRKEAKSLKTDLERNLDKIVYGSFMVVVLPNKQLSDSFLGVTKKKYRIDKIIESLKKNANEHDIYIGITHCDICQGNKNGVTDWGVLGSSISACHACVASDYRLRHKRRDFWKVVTHEFIHTFYSYPHCPLDSTHCLMKDAKGKADFSNKKDLCGYCKSKIG